jgi:hypothetical protein
MVSGSNLVKAGDFSADTKDFFSIPPPAFLRAYVPGDSLVFTLETAWLV